jgi:hypothetical protein
MLVQGDSGPDEVSSATAGKASAVIRATSATTPPTAVICRTSRRPSFSDPVACTAHHYTIFDPAGINACRSCQLDGTRKNRVTKKTRGKARTAASAACRQQERLWEVRT